MDWDQKRWPNFDREEAACRCCGELVLDAFAVDALDRLQRLRNRLGRAVTIMSGHRCADHNAIVGGAANSIHLKIAFDIALGSLDRPTLYREAEAAGFTGFGFMENGLHVDTGPPRHWDYGPKSRLAWSGTIPPGGGTFTRGEGATA